MLIQARMRVDGKWVDVRIRNISSRGLLVQTSTPPPRGSYVEIFKARHTIVARVVWSDDQRFGIHSRERLDVGALIGEAAPNKPAGTTAPDAPRHLERRSDPRRLTAANVTQRLERSRRISALVEFGLITICGAIAAMIMVSTVYETLSQPFNHVSSSLAQ